MTTHSSIFLPGKFHGQRRLASYSPWSCKELDTIERLTLLLSKFQNQKIWIFFKQINQSEQLWIFQFMFLPTVFITFVGWGSKILFWSVFVWDWNYTYLLLVTCKMFNCNVLNSFESPLEKGTAIHSSTLAWKIPWTEEPDRIQSMGSQRVGHDWATSIHFTSLYIQKGNFSVDRHKSCWKCGFITAELYLKEWLSLLDYWSKGWL